MTQTGSEQRPDSYLRSRLTFAGIVVWAVLISVLLFIPSDWRGCGYLRHGAREFLYFGYVFAWSVIFFALRLRWRLVLLAVTAPVLFLYFGLHGVAEENAGPEAGAVEELKRMQSGLQTYWSEHQEEYPESLPSMTFSPYAHKFYKYEYVPGRDASGRIVGYFVQATPVRRDCYFPLSFTIVEDGKVFYTYEPRAATPRDRILE